ncbi:MAG: hypothetical protein WCS30_04060 [Selenomonadaceae bacterium]
MSREQKEDTPQKQWEQCLHWAEEKDEDFHERCKAIGANIENFSLAKIAAFPLQSKQQSLSPFSRLTLPMSGVARMLGTTPYLAEELELWKANSANWLRACGVNRTSVLLIADGFKGEGPAWGILEGAKSLQAMVVTMSKKPWETVVEYGANTCALTAPLLGQWIDSGKDHGTCQAFFCLSNDLSNRQRNVWQAKLGVPIYRQLGIRGVQASVVAWECSQQQGYHCAMDCFWPEIIDSKTTKVIPASREGELVLTALERRSTTAIRLRTGWEGRFVEGVCACGISWPRFVLKEK